MALRWLIVDDNAHGLEAARTVQEREGIAVVSVVSSLAEALQSAEKLRPELALRMSRAPWIFGGGPGVIVTSLRR